MQTVYLCMLASQCSLTHAGIHQKQWKNDHRVKWVSATIYVALHCLEFVACPHFLRGVDFFFLMINGLKRGFAILKARLDTVFGQLDGKKKRDFFSLCFQWNISDNHSFELPFEGLRTFVCACVCKYNTNAVHVCLISLVSIVATQKQVCLSLGT